MLSDAKGNFGCLGKGHERDEVGHSYDELFRYGQRHDRLWDGSEQNVRRELGFFNYDRRPTEEEMIRRSLASLPADLAYSNYHRQSELGALLKTRTPPPQWNTLNGIDRYWTERKEEKVATGDFESRRLEDHDAAVPSDGHVRIVVPDKCTGHETLGLGMMDLTVTNIVDPEAHRHGWRIGDRVLKVNRIPVSHALEFKEAVRQAIARNHHGRSPILFDVWREPAAFRAMQGAPALGPPPAAMSPMEMHPHHGPGGVPPSRAFPGLIPLHQQRRHSLACSSIFKP